MRTLPTGTVTFLFTDIEGSTRLLLGARRPLRRGARGAPAGAPRRVRAPRRGRGRHAGRRILLTRSRARPSGRGSLAGPAASRPARCACAWGSTPASRSDRRGATSASTSTARRGSAPPRTAVRWCDADHGSTCSRARATRPRRAPAQGPLRAAAPYQLGSTELPAAEDVDATTCPIVSSSMLGRETEIRELVSMLSNGSRLVTVTGPGGTGKTRLALQVAAELVGTVERRRLLGAARRPEGSRSSWCRRGADAGRQGELAASVRDRDALLVLDNAEHLLGAAASSPSCSPSRRACGCSSRAGRRCTCRASASTALQPLPDAEAVDAVRRARPGSRAGGAAERDRGGHLPAPGRPAAGGGARRRAHEAARSGDPAPPPRARPAAPHRRPRTRPSASARYGRRSSGATSCSRSRRAWPFAVSAVFVGGCSLEAPRSSARPISTRSRRSST